VETCEVTFDETMPCSSPIFECAGDQEIGESIFMEGEQEDADWGDTELTPLVALLKPVTSTSTHDPDPSSSTTWGPCEKPPQPVPAAPEKAPAAVEGEATSSREAPRHIQRHHPPQTMISDIDQRVMRSMSYHISHFAHSAFVASFEPRDIGHALSNAGWINAMHEELQKWVYKNKQSENGVVVRNKARLVA
jgi:hypothetical protein